MRRDIARGLCVPAFLAVTAVGAAPACNPDDKPTTETSETSAASSGSTAATTIASTTTVTGTGTGATTGDAFPDCKSIMDQATCESTPSCVWPPELLFCIVDCKLIKDPQTCAMNSPCTWFDNQCDLIVI